IERMLDEPISVVATDRLGKVRRIDDARGRYIEFCKSTTPGLNLHGLKIVVDTANGAAYHITPDVLEELGAEVVAIANQPDGFNINLECGSTKPEALCRR
ncbi:MAG TPA: phosphoglucosamine mutase, partial [Alcanivorax sp.]|nr:phosphoglucosamine mutase [Alcanivorax sp.]